MKKCRFLSILLFIFSSQVCASTIRHLAYQQVDSKYNSPKETIEVELGRYRSQDGIGNCYAFTFAKKVENLCQRSNKCDLKGEEINALHLTKQFHAGIPESKNIKAGNTDLLLEVLEHKDNNIELFKESCAPFEQLVYMKKFNIDPKTGRYSYYLNEQQGLIRLYEQFSAAKECVDCIPMIAGQIKEEIKGIKATQKDIESALSKIPFDNFKVFSDVILFQLHCQGDDSKIYLPQVKTINKTNRDYPTPESKIKLIKELLSKGITPEISVCNSPLNANGERVCGGHKVMINGHRLNCNEEGSCVTEIKIFNSWGKSWQDKNNDGWVSADNFMKYVSRKPINETETVPRNTDNENRVFIDWLEFK